MVGLIAREAGNCSCSNALDETCGFEADPDIVSILPV